MIKRIRDEDKRNIIIIGLCIIVLFMVTGFSSFAQYIATDKPYADGNKRIWNVSFSSAQIISEDGGKVHGFTFSPSTISLVSDIHTSGGKVALAITIKNNGSIDAKVSNIRMEPHFTGTDNVLMKTLDGLSVGDVIKSGQTVKVVYTIKHNPRVVDYDTGKLNSRLIIDYVQAKK